jgi:hypothetical protein
VAVAEKAGATGTGRPDRGMPAADAETVGDKMSVRAVRRKAAIHGFITFLLSPTKGEQRTRLHYA